MRRAILGTPLTAARADQLRVGSAASRLFRGCPRWSARRRPANRTCEFPRIRLSTGMPVVIVKQELQLLEVAVGIARSDPPGLPGSFDARGPVAVARGTDCRRVVE